MKKIPMPIKIGIPRRKTARKYMTATTNLTRRRDNIVNETTLNSSLLLERNLRANFSISTIVYECFSVRRG
ncbi:hypothetical protein Scep_010755 [Stephania cephalantha]|uniref:Uncharacterized protein n=1 Tax=Stephania cephalantha TaxID=152367 RepID=A0AAP0JWE8_9MAGN